MQAKLGVSWWGTGRRFQMAEAAEGKDLTTTAVGLQEMARGEKQWRSREEREG